MSIGPPGISYKSCEYSFNIFIFCSYRRNFGCYCFSSWSLPIHSLKQKNVIFINGHSVVNEPGHQKTCVFQERKKNHRSDSTNPVLHNFKPLAIFCCCTAQFVLDLVINPHRQVFSRRCLNMLDTGHALLYLYTVLDDTRLEIF